MASVTQANQSSTLSITQRLSISIDVEIETIIDGAAGLTNDQLTTLINKSINDIWFEELEIVKNKLK